MRRPPRGSARPFLSLTGAVALLAALPYPVAGTEEALPRFDYVLNCGGCHRLDGSGSSAAPALTSLGDLLRTEGGRAYLVRVPGVAQAPLSDDRLAALLNWALRELSGVHGFAEYSAGEVKRLRADPLRSPSSERRRVLAR